jgi:hypothetical protein
MVQLFLPVPSFNPDLCLEWFLLIFLVLDIFLLALDIFLIALDIFLLDIVLLALDIFLIALDIFLAVDIFFLSSYLRCVSVEFLPSVNLSTYGHGKERQYEYILGVIHTVMIIGII